MFGTKNRVENYFSQKRFGYQICLAKKIWLNKKFRSEIVLAEKEIWVEKMLGGKKNLVENYLVRKKNCV